MEFLTYIFIGLAVAFLMPLIIRFSAKRNEKMKKRYPGPHNRTFWPNVATRIFYGMAIFFFALMVAGGIVFIALHAPYLIMFIVADVAFCGGIAGLLLFAYAYYRLCYELFDDEKITVVRYSKRKIYRYDEIAFYSFGGSAYNSTYNNIYNSAYMTGLTVYDSNGVKLFSCEGGKIGVEDLVEHLKAHGIPAVDPRLINEQFGGNPNYVRSKRKSAFKVGAWSAFGFAIFALLFGGMIYSLTSYVDYAEYQTGGTVQSITSNGNYCTIALYNDDNVYHINSIVYKMADENLPTDIVKGSKVEIEVGYTDEDGRRNVIGLYFDGKTYLDPDKAKQAETENTDTGLTVAKVLSLVGASLIVIWAICLAIYKLKYPDKSVKKDAGAAAEK